MTGEQHFLFGLATLATVALAPPLTPVCIGAWLLMAWLGRAVDEADVSSPSGCGGTMLMILFVGGAAILFVLVGGAMMEGRL
jgi:hypothetical protein